MIVNEIANLVKAACTRSNCLFGPGYWTHHVLPVVEYSKLIAKRHGADEEIVELAALLHDYASIKDLGLAEEHHFYGAREARAILTRLDYPSERTDHVCQCILSHHEKRHSVCSTVESQCVKDGDALAHFDSISSVFHSAYIVHHLDVGAAMRWTLRKLARNWDKASREARKIIRLKHEAALLLFGKQSVKFPPPKDQTVAGKIAVIVQETCQKDKVFGPSAWKYHVLHVVTHSLLLAEIKGADSEIVLLAALLHDHAKITDVRLSKDHHIHGAEMAGLLLNDLEYSNHRIKRVKECILSHRGSKRIIPNTIEAQCVADGDAIAHISNIAVLYRYAFVFLGLSLDEACSWVQRKLQRSWIKLSPEARTIIREKYNAAKKLHEGLELLSATW
ncbi:MAG: HD domain-containing protein [Candidatus Thorarchaeota archaeon]|jgi:uncharacterized protein